MSWAQIEKKHYEKYKRDFILCREKSERNFIINAILDSFTFVHRKEVEKSFDHFCETSSYPAERDLFLARIKEYLAKEVTSNYVKRCSLYKYP